MAGSSVSVHVKARGKTGIRSKRARVAHSPAMGVARVPQRLESQSVMVVIDPLQNQNIWLGICDNPGHGLHLGVGAFRYVAEKKAGTFSVKFCCKGCDA